MRKIWLSRKEAWTFSLRARADARSCPNGFSTTRRDHGPRPFGRVDEPRLAEARGGVADAGGRDGEVEEAVARKAPLRLERLEAGLQVDEALRLLQVAADEEEAPGEGLPLLFPVGRPAELGEGRAQVGAPGLVGVDRAGEADDGGLGGELPLAVELEEGRDELAAREVARASEDDDGRRGGRGRSSCARSDGPLHQVRILTVRADSRSVAWRRSSTTPRSSSYDFSKETIPSPWSFSPRARRRGRAP